MPRRNPTWFSVNPTYSAGSGAQVDEATARRVAREEDQARERALTGIYGERAQAAAGLRQLCGIVYAWTEKGKGARVEDLITGEVKEFRRFEDFQTWGKDMRTASATYRRAEYGEEVRA